MTMQKEELRTAGIYGDLYENPGKPLAVLIGGSRKGIPGISSVLLEYLCPRYSVFVFAYFGVPGLKPHLDRVPLEYFSGAIGILQQRLHVEDKNLTVIGSSKGGEAALLLAARCVNPGKLIACVPSRYVWQAIPHDLASMLFPRSSWTLGGKDIPYVKFRYSPSIFRELGNKKYLGCHEKGLAKNKNEIAAIDLSTYAGKLILLSSSTDPYWPSLRMSEELAAQMRAERKNVEHLALDLVGHYFLQYDESTREIIHFLEKTANTESE